MHSISKVGDAPSDAPNVEETTSIGDMHATTKVRDALSDLEMLRKLPLLEICMELLKWGIPHLSTIP